MLQLAIPESEQWDEINQEFIVTKGQKLQLEHSLVSLSKWESKWHKSFLSTISNSGMTHAETLDYIKCMTLTKNVDPQVYNFIGKESMDLVTNYISEPMTATTFSDSRHGRASKEIITAEVIYYNMISLNIPFECQKWHLNRLLTLIKVCSIKNQSPKKMGKRELMSRNAQLNAARRKQMNTRG